MARRKNNTWLWYGLYATIGYYAYTMWFAPKPPVELVSPPKQ